MSSTSAGIGSALPYQGDSGGLYLTTDGTTASWASVAGGGGVTTMTAVGSSPNANGASISTVNLTLQPADGTNPGVVTTAAQTFGGVKTFTDGIVPGTGMTLDATSLGFPGLALDAATSMLVAGSKMYLAGSAGINMQVASVNSVQLTSDTMDMTGLGNGGKIKLKSPDGTTYTATIANGGTWSIT